jgi:hypothetical protein
VNHLLLRGLNSLSRFYPLRGLMGCCHKIVRCLERQPGFHRVESLLRIPDKGITITPPRCFQSRDFIETGPPVLKWMVGVETVTDNAAGSGFSRARAPPVWTAETLHSSWTLSRGRSDGLGLSLKYQRRRVTAGLPTVDDGSTTGSTEQRIQQAEAASLKGV